MLPSKDAPLLVTEVSSFGDLRLSAWDKEKKSLVDLGWFDKQTAVGRTLSFFDWEAYAEKHR